jgi:hypothetical protein
MFGEGRRSVSRLATVTTGPEDHGGHGAFFAALGFWSAPVGRAAVNWRARSFRSDSTCLASASTSLQVAACDSASTARTLSTNHQAREAVTTPMSAGSEEFRPDGHGAADHTDGHPRQPPTATTAAGLRRHCGGVNLVTKKSGFA